MGFGANFGKRIQSKARALWIRIHKNSSASARARREPLVFAVTRCYPTRLKLYAAAFQGGWKVDFRNSIRDAAEAAQVARPRAVFYDPTAGDPGWKRYCTSLSREGVPFVLVSHSWDDDAFLAVVAAGGYQVGGDPLTSEKIVKTLDLAGEVSALRRAPVG